MTDRSILTQAAAADQPFDDPALVLITPSQLGNCFACSTRKLERDRCAGTGVAFVTIGRLVRYRLIDVLEYLEAQRRTSTSDAGPEEAANGKR